MLLYFSPFLASTFFLKWTLLKKIKQKKAKKTKQEISLQLSNINVGTPPPLPLD